LIISIAVHAQDNTANVKNMLTKNDSILRVICFYDHEKKIKND